MLPVHFAVAVNISDKIPKISIDWDKIPIDEDYSTGTSGNYCKGESNWFSDLGWKVAENRMIKNVAESDSSESDDIDAEEKEMNLESDGE